MSNSMMVQCRFQRALPNGGFREVVAWVEDTGNVRPGTFCRLQDRETKEWTDSWKVAEVYGKCLAAEIEDNERNWTKQRDASDI